MDIQRAVRDQVLTADHRVCNPGTAALAVTVGSIARNDSMAVQLVGRILRIPDAVPGAPRGGPSPFTRTGPGCSYRRDNQSIKPEFADYGGNYALQRMGAEGFRWNDWHFLVGEPTIIREQDGRFIGSRTGTSFSCPHVAHAAALAERSLEGLFGAPASANAVRALVASTARTPACGEELRRSPKVTHFCSFKVTHTKNRICRGNEGGRRYHPRRRRAGFECLSLHHLGKDPTPAARAGP